MWSYHSTVTSREAFIPIHISLRHYNFRIIKQNHILRYIIGMNNTEHLIVGISSCILSQALTGLHIRKAYQIKLIRKSLSETYKNYIRTVCSVTNHPESQTNRSQTRQIQNHRAWDVIVHDNHSFDSRMNNSRLLKFARLNRIAFQSSRYINIPNERPSTKQFKLLPHLKCPSKVFSSWTYTEKKKRKHL